MMMKETAALTMWLALCFVLFQTSTGYKLKVNVAIQKAVASAAGLLIGGGFSESPCCFNFMPSFVDARPMPRVAHRATSKSAVSVFQGYLLPEQHTCENVKLSVQLSTTNS